MTPDKLTRLNRALSDRMGFRDNGEPAFRWMRSEELLFPYVVRVERVTSESELLSIVEDIPICEQRRQCKEDCWLLAKWVPPPGRQEWQAKYGASLGYPENGYWFMLVPLRPGLEPDEELSHLCADQIDWQKSLDFRTTLSLMEAQEERIEKANKAKSDAMIEDCFTNHVPGARGGSVSMPLTSFDR